MGGARWGVAGGRRLEILLKNLVIAIDKEMSPLAKSPMGCRDVLTLLFLMIESFYSQTREI